MGIRPNAISPEKSEIPISKQGRLVNTGCVAHAAGMQGRLGRGERCSRTGRQGKGEAAAALYNNL